MTADPRNRAARPSMLPRSQWSARKAIRGLTVAVFIGALLFVPLAGAAPFSPDRLRLAEKALAETVRSLEIPGAVLAVYSPDGEVLVSAAGLSRVDRADADHHAGQGYFHR